MAEETKHTCGASLDDHIDLTLAAMDAVGSGLACEQQWQALVVLVEAGRQYHGFGGYDGKEKAAQLIAEAKALQEKQAAAKQQMPQPQPKWFIPDSSGKVH